MCRCLMTARKRPKRLAHCQLSQMHGVFEPLCWELQVLPWARTGTACCPPCCSSAHHLPAVIHLRTAPLGGSCLTGKLFCGSSVCAVHFRLHPLLHPRMAFRAMLWLYIYCLPTFVCTLCHCQVLVQSVCSSAMAAVFCRLPGSWVDRRLQRSISAQRLEDGSLLLQEHVVSPDGSRCAGGQRGTVQEGR